MLFHRFAFAFAFAAMFALSACHTKAESGASDGVPDAGPTSTYLVDPRNDGHAWVIDNAGGFCLSWTGVEDGPDGKPWLGAGGGVFRLDASNLDVNFPIDAHAIDRGPVRKLARFGDALYAAFSAPSDADMIVVSYDAAGAATPLGGGTTSPLAATDNACLGMARGDDFVVRAPGASSLATVALPKPSDGLRREIDAAVGLADAFLVRAYRGGDGQLGVLYRVACPTLDVTVLASGDAVIDLDSFVRDDKNTVWAIDRRNSTSETTYRLVKSTDEGETFTEVPLANGFQPSIVAAKKNAVVVAPPKGLGLLVSLDDGASFQPEPLDAYQSLADSVVESLHVSSSGLVMLGLDCNYLLHRRAPLRLAP